MLQAFFHAWERQLAAVTTDRVVRPFEWGLDWIPSNACGSRRSGDPRHSSKAPPDEVLGDWVAHVMADTDAFFTPPPTRDYTLSDRLPAGERLLRFPTALATPHPANNTVYCRWFDARVQRNAPRAGFNPPRLANTTQLLRSSSCTTSGSCPKLCRMRPSHTGCSAWFARRLATSTPAGCNASAASS